MRQKRGRGRPRKYPIKVVYENGDDLCLKLSELVSSKNAGNTISIVAIKAILNELLDKKFIDINEYNNLRKTIFSL